MINVIGLGYIGLPTALMLASHGVEVVGTDYNKELVDTLNAGKTTFKEDGLDELFAAAVKAGIRFTTEYQVTDMYIVSVPTPYDKKSKKVDASYVNAAVKDVLNVCPLNATIVIESTISPGTIDKYVRPEIQATGFTIGRDINLVHAPERIIPGNMVYELKHNNRTIGADNREIGEKVKDIYASFCEGEITVTDIKTAEMTKVVENTFRDINIAFANELAKICRSDNMDVYEIIRIANKHPRVNILTPGPGVGGHCISVDPWFLVGDYPGLANIILAARKINDSMPEFVLKRISEIMKENNITDYNRVGLYGLTYKENVDDVRESPTLQLLESMRDHLAPELKVYDPYVAKKITSNQILSFDEFIKDIDLVVIMVGHKQLKESLPLFKNKIIFDTRYTGLFDKAYYL
ncbi:nucleotide sugar dehydrogenase [uncultured Cloacibacillus sp.]|uniref:nucleotide sugar dehydrogenase n=1 Tax=uncultured Cloacibacillus sp. TaxID=889794 RepID=UPI0026DD1C94|nr:nucleotide sugar dehydrogenase [uncultured Cloacibacillus sp.]